ncbi:MAG: amino acid oxidase [Paenibacillus sp.]|nr:amino acid oxidase [Paenibacillus sp.]
MSAAAGKGLRVFEKTEIQSHTAKDDLLTFYTKEHRSISARYAIIATGYETQRYKRHPNAVMKSSYAIATAPLEALPGWYERCLLWETARPYLYIRTTADNRIIVGGMDESTYDAKERDSKLPHKRELLLQEVKKLFPHITEMQAEYFWTGLFVSTHDGYPLFGTQEGFPSRCLFALPYGGNGSIYSTLAARIVTSLILEGDHPDAHMFRFDRPKREPGF